MITNNTYTGVKLTVGNSLRSIASAELNKVLSCSALSSRSALTLASYLLMWSTKVTDNASTLLATSSSASTKESILADCLSVKALLAAWFSSRIAILVLMSLSSSNSCSELATH